MKRILAAIALAILALPAIAADVDRNSARTEQQSGYFDPSQ